MLSQRCCPSTGHNGLATPRHTPLGRGFQSSRGFLSAGEDHFTKGLGRAGVANNVSVCKIGAQLIDGQVGAADDNVGGGGAECWDYWTSNETAEGPAVDFSPPPGRYSE